MQLDGGLISGQAPGRVNLIGEHTDYHDGFVLPTVIPQQTRVHLRRRDDGRVRASSTAISSSWEEYEVGREEPGRGWLDYVQGVTAMLARRGVDVSGFDVQVESGIPLGAGVSSSAALEVSLLRALRTMLALDLDDVSLARIGQLVETEFVGAPVGAMDQMTSSLGREGEALFLDTRTLAFERVPIPEAIEIVVIHSGITHSHAGGHYAVRRRESFEAASQLGVGRLRDAGIDDLGRVSRLPGVLARRARHIVTENQRVLEAVDALRAGDAPRLGTLFTASHVSMRDDYEISTPEIDALVGIADAHPAVHGARLTGGGFGGAIVILTGTGQGPAVAESVRSSYARQTGRDATVLVPVHS